MAQVRILVVEDDAIIAQGIQQKLEEMGYVVLSVISSGEKAVASAEEIHPDLVLMDIILKGQMDGVEAAQVIRSRFDIPVVYLTAYADEATLQRAKNTEPEGYLIKPFKDRELRAAVDLALYRHQQERRLKRANEELEAKVAERTAELRKANERLETELAERKAIEESLRKTANRLSEAQRIAHMGSWEWDILTNRIPWSEEVYRIFRMPPEQTEATYEEFLEKVHPDDRVFVEQAINDALYNGELFSIECRIVLPDASARLIHVRGEVSFDGDGRPVRMLGTVQDITERKQAEMAIRVSEERMRLIIEASPVGIRISQHGGYMYVNPTFISMFGYDAPEEVLGLPVEMLYAPEERERIRQISQDRIDRKPSPSKYEAVGVKKNGQHFEIAVWMTAIDYQGEPADLAFIIDVSSEKALRAQLMQAQKLEALGTLSGGIAHDFNNILGIILAHNEVALLKAPKETPIYKNLQQVRNAGYRAKDLIKQILAFSRLNEEENKTLQLKALVKEALRMLRAALPTTIEIRQELAAMQGEDTIVANPTRIHQVLMNLCSNSAHAMREKGGILSVDLYRVDLGDNRGVSEPTDLDPGSYLVLKVSDTGHGMNSALLERVFEPYFTTKEAGEGSGLGLAVVHGIVKSLGGAVAVSSNPRVGTSFYVYLPRAESRPPSEESLVSDAIPGGRECILLVDDEEALARGGKQMLEQLGYRVISKTSGVDALETFRRNPDQFDLIITDQTMPAMTGMELAGKLTEIREDIPIILCSGFSDTITPERMTALGVSEYMAKPLVLADLAQSIRKLLDTRASNQ